MNVPLISQMPATCSTDYQPQCRPEKQKPNEPLRGSEARAVDQVVAVRSRCVRHCRSKLPKCNHVYDLALVLKGRADRLPGARVPEPGGPVLAAGQDGPAVGAEGRGPDL